MLNDKNCSLLAEFIDSENLFDLCTSLRHSQFYYITATILEAIEDFETHGYYPQDLKCMNIVMCHYNKSLFVVDLRGGVSEGINMKEAL
jgi:hypothetical protein